MTPWTALLESLHSAMIDELIGTYPDLKPQLGMPIRQREYRLPTSSVSSVVVCEILLERARGLGFLAGDASFNQAIRLSIPELWDKILKRAGSEFFRREIRPKLGLTLSLVPTEDLPKRMGEPTRVIWIPVKIGAGSCYLGMGV